MAYSHSHMSSHLPEDSNVRRLLYALGVTTGFMLIEAAGGFLSGSLILLADTGHVLADTAALLFTLLAVQFSCRPPTIRHTFGWLRLTTLAMFVNVIAPVVTTILIVWEAIRRSCTLRSVKDGMMMAITMAGLLASILSFWLLHHGSKEKSLDARAAALHVLGDLLSSAGAIIATLIVIWTGWTPVGPILSILASLLVLHSAWRLLKNSVNELLEGAPASLDITELKRRMCRGIPEVHSMRHVHIWMVGEKPVMALYVQAIPPYDHDALLDQIQRYLMDHYQIERIIIQMEYQLCHGPDCHLNEGMSGHSHHHH